MKRISIFALFCLLLLPAIAQEKPKGVRYIYLWDVTLSMKGYQNKTPDIYDDVVKFLIKEIGCITNENVYCLSLFNTYGSCTGAPQLSSPPTPRVNPHMVK